MALKDYPKWVLNHRGKGREIRHINGKYYLYLYHNEKVDGKWKKITDKYLGRITEAGLIPPVEKKIDYQVKLYGLTAFIFSCCKNIINGIIKRYPSRHVKLLQLAILLYFFNNDIDEFNSHYISILFPDPILKDEKESVRDEINRISSMIDHAVSKTLNGLELEEFKLLISTIYIVGIKDKWTVAMINDEANEVIKKYKIKLEIEYEKN